MVAELGTLSLLAVTIGFIHCVSGPDHYVPFVAMSRVGSWSLRKTILITLLCGVGHVAGSALLGFIGIAVGIIVFQLETAESLRGNLAAWLLVVFGIGYFLFGVVHAIRSLRVRQEPSKPDAVDASQAQAESLASSKGSMTPWILFAIFVFGPCEPLIPLLMYPAAKASVLNVVLVTLLFGVTTLVTMAALVALIRQGMLAVRFPRIQVYGHALAGFIVVVCGVFIMYEEQIHTFVTQLFT